MRRMNTKNSVNVAVAGAAGRMGQRLCTLIGETDGLELAEAFDRPDHQRIGTPAIPGSGVVIAEKPGGAADLLIDFTLPVALQANLDAAVEYGMAAVIGTTGLTEAHFGAIDKAAESVPVLWAPNFSLGMNVMFALAGQIAAKLGDDYDIEILEAHHRFKQDAPSGTALQIARSICQATGKSMQNDVDMTRVGEDPRKPGRITMQTLRMGDVVGEHTVYYAAQGERLQLGHIATTRDTFARGGLAAAKWLHGKPAGRYTMKDMLGME